MPDNHKKHLDRIDWMLRRMIPNLDSCPQFDCKIISVRDEIVIINKGEFSPKVQFDPNNKDTRLMLDVIEQMYPLYKRADIKTKIGFIRDIFNANVDEGKLLSLKPFKKIVKKTIIGGDLKLHTTVRYRNSTKHT